MNFTKLFINSLAFFPFLSLFFLAVAVPSLAQSPSPSSSNTTPSGGVIPSFYNLAPCPSCAGPSLPEEKDDGEKKYEEKKDKKDKEGSYEQKPDSGNEAPDEGNEAPEIDENDPCEAENASVAGDKKKKKWNKYGKHGGEKGEVSKGMGELLKMLLELINKLIEMLGGKPIETPDGLENPDDPQEPCEPQQGQPNQPDEDEQENPGVSGTPLPSTAMPGISYSPAPSSAMPSVSTVPGTSAAPAPSGVVPSGTALTGCTQADIQKLVDSVSEVKLKEFMDSMTDNSRHVSAASNATEVQYIKSQFDAAGVQSALQPFNSGSRSVQNIIGTITGKQPNDYIVVGGHMDSISPNTNVAPGADDNASGTAMTMEAARVLKSFSACMNKSVEFAAWNAEEVGIEGSAYYVAQKGSKNFVQSINADMVANSSGSDCVSFNYKNFTGGDVMAKKLQEVNTKYSIGLTASAKSSSSGGSDHVSFWDAGIPSAYIVECSFSPHWHKDTDRTNAITYSQLLKTTKAVVAAVAELSMQ